MKRLITCFVVGASLVLGSGYATAGLAKINPVIQKYNIKAGDVLAVEVMLNGQLQIILVRVRSDLSMYYIYNGEEVPFPVADLDNFQWAFYTKN